MTRRPTGSLLPSLLAAGALALVPLVALVASPAVAAGGHSGKAATSKVCYETATFKGKPVRVPTSCPKPEATRTCYLTSRYHHKTYRKQIDCAPTKKPGTAGSTGATGSPPVAGTGPTGSGGSGASDEGVNWATASAARCADASTATGQGGYFTCNDGSAPYCRSGTDFLVIDPQNQNVVCLPNASVPPTGVCDDGSRPGSGGTSTDGTALCSDGNGAYLRGDTAQDSASQGTCDDGSSPGDGGTGTGGALLCADGTYPYSGP